MIIGARHIKIYASLAAILLFLYGCADRGIKKKDEPAKAKEGNISQTTALVTWTVGRPPNEENVK